MKKCNESILSLMEMPNEESVTRYFKVKLSNSEESSLYLSKVYTDTSDDEFIGYPYSLSEKIMINENTDNYMSYVVSNRTRDAFDCAFCMSQDIDFEDWVCIKEDNDFLNAWNAKLVTIAICA